MKKPLVNLLFIILLGVLVLLVGCIAENTEPNTPTTTLETTPVTEPKEIIPEVKQYSDDEWIWMTNKLSKCVDSGADCTDIAQDRIDYLEETKTSAINFMGYTNYMDSLSDANGVIDIIRELYELSQNNVLEEVISYSEEYNMCMKEYVKLSEEYEENYRVDGYLDFSFMESQLELMSSQLRKCELKITKFELFIKDNKNAIIEQGGDYYELLSGAEISKNDIKSKRALNQEAQLEVSSWLAKIEAFS